MTLFMQSTRVGEANSLQLVDPYGGNLSDFLTAYRKTLGAVNHGVTKTSAGEIQMEPLVLLVVFLNPLERFPVTPAGTVNISGQYIARNHRTRISLEKRGVPASSIPRLPPRQDETVARTTNGEVADFASPEFQRAVAAINALNETQWAMVNNDLVAMIFLLVDISQLADSHELSSQ